MHGLFFVRYLEVVELPICFNATPSNEAGRSEEKEWKRKRENEDKVGNEEKRGKEKRR